MVSKQAEGVSTRHVGGGVVGLPGVGVLGGGFFCKAVHRPPSHSGQQNTCKIEQIKKGLLAVAVVVGVVVVVVVVVRSSLSVFSEKKMSDEYLVLLITRAVSSSYFSLATAAVPGQSNMLHIQYPASIRCLSLGCAPQ